MSRVIDNHAIPAAIKEKLHSIRIRASVVATLRAIAVAVTVLLIAMVLVMAADWWFMFLSTSVRASLTGGTLLATAVALLLFSIRPISQALGWSFAANKVDQEIPQMQERWTTVASFGANKQPESKAEQAMLQQVKSEAVAMGKLVKPQEIVRPASLNSPAVLLGSSIAMFALFMVSNWGQTRVLLQRFLHPTQHITATQLASASGSMTVPRGESVELVTIMSGLQKSTGMFVMEGESFVSEQQELSVSTEQPEAFICNVEVDETFRYRMLAGDGTTQWHTVTAIDFPTMEEVKLTVTSPSYIRQEPLQKSLIPGRLRVFQGSTLNLAMKPNGTLKNLVLMLTMGQANKSDEAAEPVEEALTIKPDEDGWYRFETPLVEDFSFYPEYLNVHDLKNEQRRTCRVHVIEDQAPVARIISPTDEMAVSADDEIEVKFEAHDDHGIAKAELVIYDDANTIEGEESKILAIKDIPLDDQMLKKHVMGKLKLDLKEFGLEEGASISYSIKVTDNRDIDVDFGLLDRQSMVARNDRQLSDEEFNSNRSGLKPRQKSNDSESNNNQGKATENPGKRKASTDAPSRQPDEQDSNGKDRNNEESIIAANDADPGRTTSDDDAKTNQRFSQPGSDIDAKDSAYIRDPERPDPTKSNLVQNDPADSGGAAKNESDADMDAITAKNKAEDSQPSRNGAVNSETPDQQIAQNQGRISDNTFNNSGTKQNTLKESRNRLKIDAKRDPSLKDPNSITSVDAVVADADDDSNRNGNSKTPLDPNSKDNTDGDAMLADKDSSSKETAANDEDTQSAKDKRNGLNKDRTDQRLASSGSLKTNNSSPRPANDGKNTSDKNNRIPPDGKRSGNNGMSSRLPRMTQMKAQSNANQRQRNNRRRLNITERLSAVAQQSNVEQFDSRPRRIVLQIDKQLLSIEKDLTLLVNKAVADDERSDRYRELDTQIGDVEALIDDLHHETTDTQFAFVGLQMVDIGRTHVTPARDGIFVSIRQPDVAADTYATESLHHVTTARELLDALLKQYDRVARDKKLATELEEKVTMYEIYIEKAHQLMNASRQNKDPLKMRRKMAVVEVDQSYLDRYAEVATLRREMMAEFGRMLTDDPRLLARYMDLIKRRGDSLRVRLRELAEQQAQLQDDIQQWTLVDDDSRLDLWAYFAELRLLQVGDLAQDAQAVAERIQKQLPLSLDASRGSAALVIQHSKNTALLARQTQRDAKKMLKVLGEPDADVDMTTNARSVVNELSQLMGALDQLNFESDEEEGVADYVDSRLIETRTLANQADSWMEEAGSIDDVDYSKLALISQQEISIATELLRVDMLTIEDGLDTLFGQLDVPQEIKNYARDLSRVMESITYNQTATGFAVSTTNYKSAVSQLELAMTRFDHAEELIDKIRRRSAEIIDEKQEVQNPTIDQLRDPTLDEFLQRLEREPNLAVRLGLPRRPRNLRVIQQTMMWQQNGGNMIGQSQNQAAQRARRQQMANLKRKGQTQNGSKAEQREMDDQERKDREDAKDMQAMIQQKMKETMQQMQKKAQDKNLSSEERKQLEDAQKKMQKRLQQLGEGNFSDDAWDQLAESQEMDAMLKAMQNGERIPDSVWNTFQSTLDHGLWQVGDREPPEDYRQRIQDYLQSIDRLTTSGIEDAQ